jgi:hypothetical protein
VKLAGLNPEGRYRVREINLAEGAPSRLPGHGEVFTGSVLMSEGLTPPCAKPFESAVIEASAEK